MYSRCSGQCGSDFKVTSKETFMSLQRDFPTVSLIPFRVKSGQRKTAGAACGSVEEDISVGCSSVSLVESLDSSCCVDKLLCACEERMAG